MFISSQVMRVPMEDYTIEVLPFLGAMLLVLLLLTLFPQITLWLPNYVYGIGAGLTPGAVSNPAAPRRRIGARRRVTRARPCAAAAPLRHADDPGTRPGSGHWDRDRGSGRTGRGSAGAHRRHCRRPGRRGRRSTAAVLPGAPSRNAPACRPTATATGAGADIGRTEAAEGSTASPRGASATAGTTTIGGMASARRSGTTRRSVATGSPPDRRGRRRRGLGQCPTGPSPARPERRTRSTALRPSARRDRLAPSRAAHRRPATLRASAPCPPAQRAPPRRPGRRPRSASAAAAAARSRRGAHVEPSRRPAADRRARGRGSSRWCRAGRARAPACGNDESAGSVSRTARATEAVGARPVTTKYSVAPSEYRSVHGPWPTLPSSAYCSSGANCGLRWAVNHCEPPATARRAQPKSSSTGRPSGSTRMLSGAMSRW